MTKLLNNPHARALTRAIVVAALGVALDGGDPKAILVAVGLVLTEYLTPANKTVGLGKAAR
jgi:hypothetical protein